jgi:hypothetical protein
MQFTCWELSKRILGFCFFLEQHQFNSSTFFKIKSAEFFKILLYVFHHGVTDTHVLQKYTVAKANQNEALLWKIAVLGLKKGQNVTLP